MPTLTTTRWGCWNTGVLTNLDVGREVDAAGVRDYPLGPVLDIGRGLGLLVGVQRDAAEERREDQDGDGEDADALDRRRAPSSAQKPAVGPIAHVPEGDERREVDREDVHEREDTRPERGVRLPQATPMPMVAAGGMSATAIITPTSAVETPVERLTTPATPAPSATASERKSGAMRSRTWSMVVTSGIRGDQVDRSDEVREDGGAENREDDPQDLEFDAAPEEVRLVDDGPDAGRQRRADERGDDHRSDDDGRRVQQQSCGRDDRADDGHDNVDGHRRGHRPRADDEFLPGDPLVAFVLVVALLEFLEAARDDRVGVQDDRVPLLVDTLLAEAVEDGFDGALGQGDVRDGRVVPAARLVGDDVVDPSSSSAPRIASRLPVGIVTWMSRTPMDERGSEK